MEYNIESIKARLDLSINKQNNLRENILRGIDKARAKKLVELGEYCVSIKSEVTPLEKVANIEFNDYYQTLSLIRAKISKINNLSDNFEWLHPCFTAFCCTRLCSINGVLDLFIVTRQSLESRLRSIVNDLDSKDSSPMYLLVNGNVSTKIDIENKNIDKEMHSIITLDLLIEVSKRLQETIQANTLWTRKRLIEKTMN